MHYWTHHFQICYRLSFDIDKEVCKRKGAWLHWFRCHTHRSKTYAAPCIMSSLEYYLPFPPKYSHHQYIKFGNLQIVSPSEDVKIFNVPGQYSRKYDMYYIYSVDSQLGSSVIIIPWELIILRGFFSASEDYYHPRT